MKRLWAIVAVCWLLIAAGIWSICQIAASRAPGGDVVAGNAATRIQQVSTGQVAPVLPRFARVAQLGELEPQPAAIAGLPAQATLFTQGNYQVAKPPLLSNPPRQSFALLNTAETVKLEIKVDNKGLAFDYFLYQSGKKVAFANVGTGSDAKIEIEPRYLTDPADFKLFVESTQNKAMETVAAETAANELRDATKDKNDKESKANAAKQLAEDKARLANSATDKVGLDAKAKTKADNELNAQEEKDKKPPFTTAAKLAASTLETSIADAATATDLAKKMATLSAAADGAYQKAVEDLAKAIKKSDLKREEMEKAREAAGLAIKLVPPVAEVAPRITQASNGEHVGLSAFASNKPQVNVYDGYLRVKVFPGSDGLEFFLLAKKNTELQTSQLIKVLDFTKHSDGAAVVTLKIEEIPADITTTEVICRLKTTQSGKSIHGWSFDRVPIKYTDNSDLNNARLTEPTFPDLVAEPWQSNQTTVKAKGKLNISTLSTRTLEDFRVLITHPDIQRPIVTVPTLVLKDNIWEATVDLPPQEGLSARKHLLTAQLARGDKVASASLAFSELVVQARGPRVLSVSPSNIGVALGVNTLKVVFDPGNPIDNTKPTSTADFRNLFTLKGSNNNGQFEREAGDTIAPQTARLENNTVELAFLPAQIKTDIYRLEISGELKDKFGNKLEGDRKTKYMVTVI